MLVANIGVDVQMKFVIYAGRLVSVGENRFLIWMVSGTCSGIVKMDTYLV